jgi:NAD(P)H-dependent FMN reductase
VPDDPRLSIPVLICTIRASRRSAHVARLLLGQLEGRDEVGTARIALVDLDLPVTRHRLGQTDAAPPGTVGPSEKLSRADGLVIVAPNYKNGYPGSLKNAFDYLPAARPCGATLRRKPIGSLTVSSGGFGGLSCLAPWRLVFLAMGVSRSRLRSPSPGSIRRSTSRAPCAIRNWPPASGHTLTS